MKLFTIRQVCACSGLSRATILRLENKGLLIPARVDAQTGYRYYDNYNMSCVMQIKMFLSMDMSYEDIALYYNSQGCSAELLEKVEQKFLTAKRAYEEIRLRVNNKQEICFEFTTLPRCVCFTKRYRGITTDEVYQNMYNLYYEAVEKGYRLLSTEPLFVINEREDYLNENFSDKKYDYTCCIPLEPESPPEEAVVYPSSRAFSCLFYGSYEYKAKAYNEFGREIKRRGLKPTGYIRALGLVGPYTGRDISKEQFVSRFVIPIEGN